MPSVLDTLPSVDPGFLGTNQTLQSTTTQSPVALTNENLQKLFELQFRADFLRVNRPGAIVGLGNFGASPLPAEAIQAQQNVASYLTSIGRSGQSVNQVTNELLPPLSTGFYRYDDPLITLMGGWNKLINDPKYVTYGWQSYFGTPYWGSAVDYGKISADYRSLFNTRYAGNNLSLYIQDYQNSIVNRQPTSQASIWDRVFSTPFITTFVENPISAIQKVNTIFSNSPDDNIQPIFKAAVGDVPRVDFSRLGLQSGVNVVSNIGFAYGVEGITQGISAGVSASTTLPAGTYGPVSPGFWASLGSGNVANAWQIAGNTLGVATGGPSTFLSRQGGNLAIQQIGQTIVGLTGKAGRAIGSLLNLDIAGFLQTIGVVSPPGQPGSIVGQPGSIVGQPFGTGGGGSGGGGGFLPSQNTGQTSASSVIIPIMGIGVVILTLWYFMRKKA